MTIYVVLELVFPGRSWCDDSARNVLCSRQSDCEESVLIRAFFYNSGMPDVSDSKEPASDVMSCHRLCQRVQRSLDYLVMHKPRQYPPILFGRIKKSHLGGQEQLVLLEVLFWAMWGFVPCSGSLVVAIFNTAYAMNLPGIDSSEQHTRKPPLH